MAALFGGLETRHPSNARILEIGCCSGLNLIPLALRWPDSRFVGIDLAETSITEARQLAAKAGATNIEFHALDLRDYQPDESFDFIIAHGFFSWVPDEVKTALLEFCGKFLAPAGIATISFNLECGWRPRFPVIRKVRAIREAGAVDEMSALAVLRSVTEADSAELAIIDDMLAKGPDILAFDDFGPVNDPWPLDRFVQAAGAAGLRWLGESDPGKNLPPALDERTVENLRRRSGDALSFQMAADAAGGRTFRSGVLCRADYPEQPLSLEKLLDLALRAGPRPADDVDRRIWEAIQVRAPHCIPMRDVLSAMPGLVRQDIARRVYDGIQLGWILPRMEPVAWYAAPPEFPRLNDFRLECARRQLPLVDIWHQPCSFPMAHYEVLAAMDGTRDQAGLARISNNRCPELAFSPWLRHLAERGMFT